jgi:PAS domain S-box-containing protein
MSIPANRTDVSRPEARAEENSDDLRQCNAALRAEASRLLLENEELSRRIAAAMKGSQADREARRAALNLMEDAVTARRAEHRENAERRRAEDELRSSEAKYRSLFESIDEGFFIIERIGGPRGETLDFRFLEANPAVAPEAGVRGVVGKTFQQVFPGESDEWRRTFDRVLTSGKSIRFERELATKDRALELYAFRVNDGVQHRVAVIFKDISERKRFEAALREADRRKDEFLAVLAHELRNPLAPIRSSLDILRMNASCDGIFRTSVLDDGAPGEQHGAPGE